MKEKNTGLRAFWIALGAGAALSVIIALLRGLNGSRPLAENAGILSDGFFIIGVLTAGVGGLLAIAGKTDFFDMLAYGVKSLAVMFTPFRKPEKHPRYYEYKMQRKERRKPPRMFLLWAGLVLIALAAACLIFTA